MQRTIIGGLLAAVVVGTCVTADAAPADRALRVPYGSGIASVLNVAGEASIQLGNGTRSFSREQDIYGLLLLDAEGEIVAGFLDARGFAPEMGLQTVVSRSAKLTPGRYRLVGVGTGSRDLSRSTAVRLQGPVSVGRPSRVAVSAQKVSAAGPVPVSDLRLRVQVRPGSTALAVAINVNSGSRASKQDLCLESVAGACLPPLTSGASVQTLSPSGSDVFAFSETHYVHRGATGTMSASATFANVGLRQRPSLIAIAVEPS